MLSPNKVTFWGTKDKDWGVCTEGELGLGYANLMPNKFLQGFYPNPL